MAQQEGGWPLGLQPLNVRVGLIRNLDYSGSLSFSTLVTASPSSSSVTSSDLDTESTGSFFHDRSITLGSLIGITNILELSRSVRSRRQCSSKEKKNHKTKICFSLCPRAHLDTDTAGNAPSLGHFLEAERRAGNAQGTNRASTAYELEDLAESQLDSEPNSLFSNGLIVPPPVYGDRSPGFDGDAKKSNTLVCSDDGRSTNYKFPLLSACMGGQTCH